MDKQAKIFIALGVLALLALGTTIFLVVCRRKAARDALEKELASRLATEASAQIVAPKNGLPWPVQAPTAPKADVTATLTEHVRKEASEKFAESSNVARIAKEAEALYRTRKVGERVSFRIWRPGTGEERVEGILRGVTDDKVHVGPLWIDRREIIKKDRHLVYEDVSKARVEHHVRTALATVRRQRARFTRQLAAKNAPRFYREARYVRSPADGKWISQAEALEILVSRTKKQVEKQVYQAHGYIQEDGQWVRQSVFAKLRHKVNDFFTGKNRKSPAPEKKSPPAAPAKPKAEAEDEEPF